MAHQICDEIAAGASVKSICKKEGYPPQSTFLGWVVDDVDGLTAHYARARQVQAEGFADELQAIVDDGSNDWMEVRKTNGEVTVVLDREHVARSKLRFEARQWIASKILKGKYGDKLEVTGANGGAIKTINANVTVPTDPVEAARVYREMMGRD